MANKFIPKTSGAVQNPKFPTKGPHNPNVGTHGSGPAPRNAGPGTKTDKLSAPVQGGIARVQNAGNAPAAGNFLPIRKPKAGVQNQSVGQSETLPTGPGSRVSPMTSTPVVGNPVASAKPKRKGGAAFYGE